MNRSEQPPEWYRQWFGEEYLALYPHRDEYEAQEGVELLLHVLGRPAGKILDLACGAGRHMLEFHRRGLAAVGLDLSLPLLQQARALGPRFNLVRGDMRRLPFDRSSFELVANFFTSFGYFADPDEDLSVLKEIRRVLRGDGRFALDFLNAERVRNRLVDVDERRVGRRRVVQQRRLEEEGKVVVKEIRIFGDSSGSPIETYFERVRLYGHDDLMTMLRDAGLETEHSFGDYSGASFSADAPRCILLGRAV